VELGVVSAVITFDTPARTIEEQLDIVPLNDSERRRRSLGQRAPFPIPITHDMKTEYIPIVFGRSHYVLNCELGHRGEQARGGGGEMRFFHNMDFATANGNL